MAKVMSVFPCCLERRAKANLGQARATDGSEFLPRLYDVLPARTAGDITVADAAKPVGCSRRAHRRYRDQE